MNKIVPSPWGKESHPRIAVGNRPKPIDWPQKNMRNPVSIVDELENAIHGDSQLRRAEILRSVTDLFLGNADQFTGEQVELFGDVLGTLTKQVESNILAELGARLAPVDNAPQAIIQNLARHDTIAVAGPVLARSNQLTDGDLIEVAKVKSQAHLGAISERARIASVVTDILVERGDTAVVRKLTQNQGASFSDAGFTKLTKRAETDVRLAENLAMRVDLPPQFLQALVAKATDAVRMRLSELVPPGSQAVLQDLLAAASTKLLRETSAPRDYTQAEATIDRLNASAQLNEASIIAFATAGKYEETAVSLARLCAAPVPLIAKLMQNTRPDGVLVACKAAGLHWPAFKAVLTNRFSGHKISAAELEQARVDFLKLSGATAKRMFRFWLIRSESKEQIKPGN